MRDASESKAGETDSSTGRLFKRGVASGVRLAVNTAAWDVSRQQVELLAGAFDAGDSDALPAAWECALRAGCA